MLMEKVNHDDPLAYPQGNLPFLLGALVFVGVIWVLCYVAGRNNTSMSLGAGGVMGFPAFVIAAPITAAAYYAQEAWGMPVTITMIVIIVLLVAGMIWRSLVVRRELNEYFASKAR